MLRYHIDQIPDLRVSDSMTIDLRVEDEIQAAPRVFFVKGAEEDFRSLSGRISATLGRDGTDVLVDLAIEYSLGLTCVRCLEVFVRSGETRERTLFFHEKNPAAGEIERYGADGWIDLAPWVRELVLADLPFYPACRPDCLGLCPECGEDRNSGACRCPSPV